jgi:hypothetical protein
VFGSKAVGEPPLMLAISVYEAIKDAIAAAHGGQQAVTLTAPATAENAHKALTRRWADGLMDLGFAICSHKDTIHQCTEWSKLRNSVNGWQTSKTA